MNSQSLFSLTLLLFFLILSITTSHALLSKDYYKDSCPEVEAIVRTAVEKKHQQTIATAPATLRLFFHDSFVRGCDASVMLFSRNNTAEKDFSDNLSLAGDGFDTVIKAKEAVESVPRCKNKVSCADIMAMAARDVVSLTGGPSYEVELGRVDGRISTKASVHRHLPNPDFKIKQLNSMFASHGLSLTDLVALSGAHTIGFSHCNRVFKRVYGFKNPRVVIDMDPNTPRRFDNEYYKNLQQGKGLFTSDQALFNDKKTRPVVNLFAANATAFEEAFVAGMTRLGRIGVKTGSHGEIRRDCTTVN